MASTLNMPTLRGYQNDSIEAVCDALAIGYNRALVKKPTGTGKTVTFAAMPTHPRLKPWLDKQPTRGAFMLVIAHREELLTQAQAKISAANPKLVVDIEQAGNYASPYADVIIASIQTLQASKFRRLKRLIARHHFKLVIIDEAHHAAAPSYRTALVHLGFLPPDEASDEENPEAADYDDVKVMEQALAGWDARAPKDRLLVGVTATPNRSDAIGLGCVFQTIAYSYALKQAITDGYLVPIRPLVIESDVSLDAVATVHGDFNQRQLAAAVNREVRNELAVAAWLEHAKGKPTLAFTVDVAHAHALADAFTKAGVTAKPVSGETPKDERRELLAAFQRGQIDVITNCMVLTEGTDLPLTACILHAKPTKSATLYEQMTGRGLRPHPGKSECLVIDVVDIARKHSLQTAPVLYGLPPGVEPEEQQTLDEFERDLAAFMADFPDFDIEAALREGRLTLKDLRAKATAIDVWKVVPLSPELAAVSKMNWLTLTSGYRLTYPWRDAAEDGNEVLSVQTDMLGKWEVSATWRPKDRESRTAARQRTLATGFLTAQEALQAAEVYVQGERRQAGRLVDREAPWRSTPASPGQLGLLRKLKVPFRPGITKGAASDLINTAKAGKGWR